MEDKEFVIEKKNRNAYIIICKKIKKVEVDVFPKFPSNKEKVDIWHLRLQYFNAKIIKELQFMVCGLNLGHSTMLLAFKGYIQGKQHKILFSNGIARRANQLIEFIHFDVRCPMKRTSFGGARYFINLIDYFSMKVWKYIIKAKHVFFVKFKE